jgi:hypothetical protein
MTNKAGRLEIDEDLTFQRREWHVQRIGWFLLCAFVLAALLGVFGSGPLSHARAGEPGSPLWVEYERFVRQGTGDRVTIHVPAGESRETLEIRVSRDYVDTLRIERITPEPDAMGVNGTDVVLRFLGDAANSSRVVLDVEPLTIGPKAATIGTQGAPSVTLTQLVYF